MKALWFSLIMLGRKRLSLFAKTFVASLEIIMLRLIGLYCVILVGFFIFGMRIMWVSLNFGGLMPRFK